jgi:hypothetical protein
VFASGIGPCLDRIMPESEPSVQRIIEHRSK